MVARNSWRSQALLVECAREHGTWPHAGERNAVTPAARLPIEEESTGPTQAAPALQVPGWACTVGTCTGKCTEAQSPCQSSTQKEWPRLSSGSAGGEPGTGPGMPFCFLLQGPPWRRESPGSVQDLWLGVKQSMKMALSFFLSAGRQWQGPVASGGQGAQQAWWLEKEENFSHFHQSL